MNLELLKKKALLDNVPIIKPEAEKVLVEYLRQSKPKNVVEIWTAVGYSSLVISQTIQDWTWNLTTFEVSYPSYMQAISNFKNFQQYNITAYNLDPLQINLKKIFTKKIDFLFIDAVMKLYLDFYLKFEDLLENNSFVLLDNVVKFKSKSQSLYEFLEKNQIDYKIFPVPPNDGIMVFRK
jgi:predicted O-methyltransferase YrrM